MMVNSILPNLVFLGLGAVLAGIHFGGLWLTVRMLPNCARPRLFFWSGCIGRYAVTLLCFSKIMAHGGAALASAFAGFYLTRSFMLSSVSGVGMSEFLVWKRPSWK